MEHLSDACAEDPCTGRLPRVKGLPVHTGAGRCHGTELCALLPLSSRTRLGHRVFWSLIFCGIRSTILHVHWQKCHAGQVVGMDYYTPYQVSMQVGLMCQKHSVMELH